MPCTHARRAAVPFLLVPPFLLLTLANFAFAYVPVTPLGGPQPRSQFKFDASGNPHYLALPPQPGAAPSAIVSGNGSYPGYLVSVDPNGLPLSIAAFAVKPDGSVLLAANNQLMSVGIHGNIRIVAPLNVTPDDMAVDGAGNVYLTGTISGGAPAFILSLNPAGAPRYMESGYGGAQITVDANGDAYTVGTQDFPQGTPGSFQPDFQHAYACVDTTFHSFGGVPPDLCSTQDIAAVDATGTLIFATFLGGSENERPASISVDSSGNIYVAGTTDSTDYPVTPGDLQSKSSATFLGQVSYDPAPFPLSPPTGYVSKLNHEGTALIFSTYFGGSVNDSITAAVLDQQNGLLYLAGLANSPDFPGLQDGARACVPSTFVTALSLDGAAVSPTQTMAPFALASHVTGLGLYQAGVVIADGTNTAYAVLSSNSQGQIACLVNSADMSVTSSVVPGQLLTLFGSHLAQGIESVQPVNGNYPTAAGGFTAAFAGVPAPLLYVSPDQVNLQVPFEIADYSPVTLASNGGPAGANLMNILLAVIPVAPASFQIPLAPGECAGQIFGQMKTLALNEDGSVNGCGNPARPGSTVTLYLSGAGLVGPPLPTGAVTMPNPGASSVMVTSRVMTSYLGAPQQSPLTPLPGTVDGVYSYQVTLPTVQAGSVGIASQICPGETDASGQPICFSVAGLNMIATSN